MLKLFTKFFLCLGEFCLYGIVDLTYSHNMPLPWLCLPANIHGTYPLTRYWLHQLLENEIFSPETLLLHFLLPHSQTLAAHKPCVCLVFISICHLPYHFCSVEPDPTNKSAAAHYTVWQPTCPKKYFTPPIVQHTPATRCSLEGGFHQSYPNWPKRSLNQSDFALIYAVSRFL